MPVRRSTLIASEKTFSFASPPGASGLFYFGGGYIFGASDNDFSPAITFGTANTSYGTHFFVVLGATAVDDITITISGTSIIHDGTRTESDTDEIIIPSGTAVNSYFETRKKWLGQITIETTAGTAKTCNYGFVKYWDNDNRDFRIQGVESTWLGGANDTAPDIRVYHHRSSGWTFNSGAEPTPPTAIVSMATDHSTEKQVKNNVSGAWKHDGLNVPVKGNNGEGTIIGIVTTANKAFEQGSVVLSIQG